MCPTKHICILHSHQDMLTLFLARRFFHTPVLIRATRRNISENGYKALTGWPLQWRGDVSPVKYELRIYIPEDDILNSHRRKNLKSYIALTGWALQRRRNVSPVRYEMGFYIPEDILHSHCCGNLKSYIALTGWTLYRGRSPVR
jgi:hypothetical protein